VFPVRAKRGLLLGCTAVVLVGENEEDGTLECRVDPDGSEGVVRPRSSHRARRVLRDSALAVLCFAASSTAQARPEAFRWQDPNPEPVEEYRLYIGSSSGVYSSPITIPGTSSEWTIDVTADAKIFAVVTAYANGLESAYSNEVYRAPGVQSKTTSHVFSSTSKQISASGDQDGEGAVDLGASAREADSGEIEVCNEAFVGALGGLNFCDTRETVEWKVNASPEMRCDVELGCSMLEVNIGSLQLTGYPQYFEDRLYRIRLETERRFPTFYATDVKNDWQRLAGLIESKYGPSQIASRRFPALSRLRDDYIVNTHEWNFGRKTLYVGVSESDSKIAAVIVILDETLDELRKRMDRERDREDEKAAKDLF
jgi:hypothetical protein